MNPANAAHVRPYVRELLNLCSGKVDEFRLLGYEEVTLNEVWAFVCTKMKAEAPLYQWVDFILSIRITNFMNYQTMAAYKGEIES